MINFDTKSKDYFNFIVHYFRLIYYWYLCFLFPKINLVDENKFGHNICARKENSYICRGCCVS